MLREQRRACMLYPEDKFKHKWDAVMALVLILTCAVTPIRIAFYERDDIVWMVINYIIDFLFLCDIVLIFNTAFYDENYVIIEDRPNIAREYLKTWFIIDALSVFPFAEIAEAFNTEEE